MKLNQCRYLKTPQIKIATKPSEELARHYTEAGLHEQAVSYWHKAGQRAMERSALVEAIVHCTKGLEVLQMLPVTRERAQEELKLYLTLDLLYLSA